VFGVAVHSLDGVEVSGPNTRDAGLVPDKIDGIGTVDLAVPRLLLLPGTYDLSGAVYDYSRTHPYDHRHRVARFDVEPATRARSTASPRWVGSGMLTSRSRYLTVSSPLGPAYGSAGRMCA
jgi:Wzt C-terminal domain